VLVVGGGGGGGGGVQLFEKKCGALVLPALGCRHCLSALFEEGLLVDSNVAQGLTPLGEFRPRLLQEDS